MVTIVDIQETKQIPKQLKLELVKVQKYQDALRM